MNVLVLNCGSSSVKFQVVETGAGGERKRLSGIVDEIGARATLRIDYFGAAPPEDEKRPVADHEAAMRLIVERLGLANATGSRRFTIDVVGHRVVHGGSRFATTTLITGAVLAEIEALSELAPLHNPAAVSGIHAMRKLLGARVPMAAAFDTSFHQTMPQIAALYAIPRELSEKHSIRRYGFHGLAHQFSLLRYSELIGIPAEMINLVTLHLGNGCSACAIRDGRSVDTSMGFTPLEGLVMGTRSGDLDPALVSYLAREEKVDAAQVEDWLNKRSGLLGLSGRSNDMRELLGVYDRDPRARFAVNLFCYRARKYLGAYLAARGGAQAVIFSGGIGENAPSVREKICAGMEWCGLILDADKNSTAVGVEARISVPSARLAAYVIPSDEGAIIARETARLILLEAK
ncbi:MAG: acetate/propionate family kinase [Chloroflexota bacterium]